MLLKHFVCNCTKAIYYPNIRKARPFYFSGLIAIISQVYKSRKSHSLSVETVISALKSDLCEIFVVPSECISTCVE